MPEHVLQVLKSLPPGTHPMTQFAQGILALQAGRGGGGDGAATLACTKNVLPASCAWDWHPALSIKVLLSGLFVPSYPPPHAWLLSPLC